MTPHGYRHTKLPEQIEPPQRHVSLDEPPSQAPRAITGRPANAGAVVSPPAAKQVEAAAPRAQLAGRADGGPAELPPGPSARGRLDRFRRPLGRLPRRGTDPPAEDGDTPG
jgi:hypothetical protein